MIQRTRIVSRLIGRLLPHKIASLVRFYKPSMLVKPTGKRSYFVNQRRDQSPKAIQALRSSKNIFLPHLHNNSHLRPLLFPPEHRPSSAIQLRSLLFLPHLHNNSHLQPILFPCSRASTIFCNPAPLAPTISVTNTVGTIQESRILNPQPLSQPPR